MKPRLSRSYWILWSAQALSLLGNFLQFVALPLWVLSVTGSPLATGLTFAVETLPVILLGPWAGYLADRFERRNVVLLCELASALAVAGLLLATHTESLAGVYAAALAIRALNAVTVPATQAIIRAGVDEAARPRASASYEALFGAAVTIGPVAGAALFAAYGIGAVLTVNLVSFAASALLTLLVDRCPGVPGLTGTGRATVAAVGEFVRNRRLVRVGLAEALYFLLFGGETALCLLLAEAGLGARLSGLYFAGVGIGWVLMSVLGNGRYGRHASVLVRVGAVSCLPLGFLLWFTVGWNPVACFLAGLAAGATNILIAGGAAIVYQQQTSTEAAGRIFALRRAMTNGCLAASYLALPALATVIGTGQTLALAGTATAVCMLIALGVRPATAPPRDPRRRLDHPDSTVAASQAAA